MIDSLSTMFIMIAHHCSSRLGLGIGRGQSLRLFSFAETSERERVERGVTSRAGPSFVRS
jgi:hypothetical protein